MKKDKTTTDRKYIKLQRMRKLLRCDICPPNKGENAGRFVKRGVKKPKAKDKRIQKVKNHGCPPGCSGCEHE